MLAEIISVGDELLTGISVNSNAAFIGEKLAGLGFDVHWITTVGDNEEDIINALGQAYNRASLVILTGGLGPTHDDITKKVVSQFFDSEMVFREEILKKIEKRFQKMGRKMSPPNRGQAEVPEKAEIIENGIGTAPGLVFKREGRTFFILPGVPAEMRRMMEKSILPVLRKMGSGRITRSKILRTVGIPESDLYQLIKDFPDRFPEIKLSFLPQAPGVLVRMVVSGLSVEACEERLALGGDMIREKAARFIYGEGNASLENILANYLFDRKLTIGVAESCTGGLISHKLTNVAGSSGYFNRGIVAYSNEAKIEILGVPEEILLKHGAVSPETAVAMAEGMRRISETDIGLSTTGIAGPGGATPTKPVGLVFMAYADEKRSFSEKYLFGKDRMWNKERSAVYALNLVRRVLLGYV